MREEIPHLTDVGCHIFQKKQQVGLAAGLLCIGSWFLDLFVDFHFLCFGFVGWLNLGRLCLEQLFLEVLRSLDRSVSHDVVSSVSSCCLAWVKNDLLICFEIKD